MKARRLADLERSFEQDAVALEAVYDAQGEPAAQIKPNQIKPKTSGLHVPSDRRMLDADESGIIAGSNDVRITMLLPRSLAVAATIGFAGQWAAAQEPAPSAAEVPTLPPGFTATLFAAGLATPRHIAVRDNGDVYVTLRSGAAKFRPTDEPGGVVALRDTDGDGIADVSGRFGGADVDTGLAISGDNLFYSSMTTIYAVALGGELLPTGGSEIVVADLPESCCGHRTKPITLDRDGGLYTQIGSPSNACQAEQGTPGSRGLMPCTLLDRHGGVFRFSAIARNQQPTDGSRYSTGHRNVVALEWNAAAGALYLLMHGRDGLSQLWPEHYSVEDDIELPAEEFHRLDEGDDLGWPYSYYDPRRRRRIRA